MRTDDDATIARAAPNDPKAGFSVGFAMERNKFMYALSDWVLVVSSARGTGGTWSGAIENLKKGWVPLFVREGVRVPDGNTALLAQGAHPFPARVSELPESLREWLDRAEQAEQTPAVISGANPLPGVGVAYEQMHLLPDSASLDAKESVEMPVMAAASPKGSRALTNEATALLAVLPQRFRRSDLMGLCPGIMPSRFSALLSALKRRGLIEIVGTGGGPVWRLTAAKSNADD